MLALVFFCCLPSCLPASCCLPKEHPKQLLLNQQSSVIPVILGSNLENLGLLNLLLELCHFVLAPAGLPSFSILSLFVSIKMCLNSCFVSVTSVSTETLVFCAISAWAVVATFFFQRFMTTYFAVSQHTWIPNLSFLYYFVEEVYTLVQRKQLVYISITSSESPTVK